jgi:hypothetical protein
LLTADGKLDCSTLAFDNPLEGIIALVERNIGASPPAELGLGCPLGN